MKGSMIPFDLAIALGIVNRSSDMLKPRMPKIFIKIFCSSVDCLELLVFG